MAAASAYLFCTELLTRLRGVAGAVFVGIRAFGAFSYVGFILIVLTLGASPARGLLHGTFHTVSYIVAYCLPGSIGAWLSLRALKLAFPPHP